MSPPWLCIILLLPSWYLLGSEALVTPPFVAAAALRSQLTIEGQKGLTGSHVTQYKKMIIYARLYFTGIAVSTNNISKQE
jgi:hypothetical protein